MLHSDQPTSSCRSSSPRWCNDRTASTNCRKNPRVLKCTHISFTPAWALVENMGWRDRNARCGGAFWRAAGWSQGENGKWRRPALFVLCPRGLKSIQFRRIQLPLVQNDRPSHKLCCWRINTVGQDRTAVETESNGRCHTFSRWRYTKGRHSDVDNPIKN